VLGSTHSALSIQTISRRRGHFKRIEVVRLKAESRDRRMQLMGAVRDEPSPPVNHRPHALEQTIYRAEERL